MVFEGEYMSYCLAYVTTPDRETALSIARIAVGSKVAACSNVLSGMTSVYWWQGKVCEGDECLLTLKTVAAHKERLVELIKKEHPYECPCIVFLPIEGGNEDFFSWIDQNINSEV